MPIIQPAIQPASAQLLLAIDPQGEVGGSLGAESPFSVLLEAEIGAGLTGLAKEDVAAPTPGPAPREIQVVQSGKLPGKPIGKILPEPRQFAALAVATKVEDISPQFEAAAAFPADSKSDAPGAADAAPLPLPVAFAIITPLATNAVVQSKGLPAPTHAAPQQSKALTGRATGLDAPLLSPAAAPETPPLALRRLGQKLLARITLAPTALPPAAPTLANAPEIRVALAGAPAAVPKTLQPALVARSILASLGLARTASPAQVATAAAESANAATVAMAANPAPLPLPVQPEPASLAVIPRQLSLRTSGDTRDAVPAAAKPAAILAQDSDRPSAALPTGLTWLEAAPLLVPDQATLPATAPAIAAPAITTPTSAAAPHDFSALVDRLVEARQAAQSTLASQTVTAAVTHAEFGQVSLQFRQDSDGLSVVMASANPDLARAVQAAAPAAQSGGNSDANQPQRQENGGQQSASANQTQAQAQQQRGQSPQHRADDPRGSANPSPRQRNQEDPSARGGIFA